MTLIRRGGKWSAKFTRNGKQVWVPGGPWERKADAKAAEQRHRDFIANRRSETTCEAFAQRWLVDWARPEGSTRKQYAYAAQRFADHFGQTPLEGIDRPAAYTWALTVPRRVSQVVRTMFGDAYNVGLVKENPFANLRLPATEREQEITAPTMAEYRELLKACTVLGGYGPEFKAMIQFAAWTGLRQGELFGLHWDDIEGDEIHIQRSRKLDGTLGKPKNGRKRRVMYLPPARSLDSVPRRPDPFVFHSIRGNPLLKGTHAWSWGQVRAAAGLRTRWHDLRHFCATQLLELGLSHFDVSIQLGHTDNGALVMARYGHPSEDAARRRLLGAFTLDSSEIVRKTGSETR